MKKFVLSTLSILLSFSASAACVGSDAFSYCTDNQGNSYNVQRIGDSTYVSGQNSQGDSWSQNTQRIGNTTYHNGTAANGNNWNGTTSSFGGTTVHQGTDSNGESYYRSCNQFGCN